MSITFKEFDKHSTINTNSRGDDPFNLVRSRLFVQKAWTDNIHLYLEFLWDSGTDARVQGLYLTFSEVLDPMFTLKVGMIPSPFGNFGHRSTYFNQNPLIGVPAMWLTKTTLTNPYAKSNDGYQLIGNLGLHPITGSSTQAAGVSGRPPSRGPAPRGA